MAPRRPLLTFSSLGLLEASLNAGGDIEAWGSIQQTPLWPVWEASGCEAGPASVDSSRVDFHWGPRPVPPRWGLCRVESQRGLSQSWLSSVWGPRQLASGLKLAH